MNEREQRLAALTRRAAWEREDLATTLAELRADAHSFADRWAFAGRTAAGLAAAATAAWKLFGRNSPAARAGRIATAASLLLGIGRGVWKLRRFF
jgi:hypothetical protein